MNLNRSMLVAVAVVLGSLGAMGCKASKGAEAEGSEVQPPVATPLEETPAAAKDEAIEAKASIMVTNQAPVQYAPVAPPAPRYENPGRPPSANQMWIEGYHRWGGREYVWVPGHWELRRDGYDYQRTVWVNENGHWACHEGRWVPSNRVSDIRDQRMRERLERERLERERLLERARFERERVERERLERARLERERLERARLERERLERERLERARLERERLERERLERERLERERLAKAERDRKVQERIAQDRKAPKTPVQVNVPPGIAKKS